MKQSSHERRKPVDARLSPTANSLFNDVEPKQVANNLTILQRAFELTQHDRQSPGVERRSKQLVDAAMAARHRLPNGIETVDTRPYQDGLYMVKALGNCLGRLRNEDYYTIRYKESSHTQLGGWMDACVVSEIIFASYVAAIRPATLMTQANRPKEEFPGWMVTGATDIAIGAHEAVTSEPTELTRLRHAFADFAGLRETVESYQIRNQSSSLHDGAL